MDWNNDGMDDLIVGNVDGYIYYFRRTGNGVSDLTTVGPIMDGNDSLDVGLRATPFATDWNNDGKIDLIVGSQTRAVRLYLNIGTSSNPVFDGFIKLQNGSLYLKHANSRPLVYDFNGDGKKDIIISCYVNKGCPTYYYENIGTDANPIFNGYQEIRNHLGNPMFPGSYINIWLADWNGDNLIDFLASNSAGRVYVSYAISTAVSEETSATIVSSMEISAAVNPARNSFSVRLTDPGDSVDITVHDSSGRIVGSRIVNDRSELVVMPANELPTGVYTILASDDNNVSSCRIVLVK